MPVYDYMYVVLCMSITVGGVLVWVVVGCQKASSLTRNTMKLDFYVNKTVCLVSLGLAVNLSSVFVTCGMYVRKIE